MFVPAMSVWSPDSIEQLLGRKVVPGGSNHFQKVLGDIICREDKSNIKPQHETYPDQEQRNTHNHDNFTTFRLEANNSLKEVKLTVLTNTGEEKNNNDTLSSIACPVDKCQHKSSINKDNRFNVSVGITNYFSNKPDNSETTNNEPFGCLQETEGRVLGMGTSCSSNLYDNREWHNVKDAISIESGKPKKRGRFLKKRTSNDRANDQGSVYKPSEEAGTEKIQVTLDLCKCEQPDSNSLQVTQPIRPQTIQANGVKKPCEKRISLSPEDIFETGCVQLTNNRLSPNVDSAGRVHLSRTVGSGRARATTECDVSPHRLLTRRSNSPNGRLSSLDAMPSTTNHYVERPRSQSWSNGKLGDKASFKTNSLSIRQSLTNSIKSLKAGSPLLSGDRSLKNAPTPTTTITKSPKAEGRDSDCLFHIKPEEVPTISISKARVNVQDDDDFDLVPVTRRRAASESQTMRPRRLLPRTPDSSDQIQEHAHVRWADEKKGSSLSTSVFLTSIRPRSRSYGAMDSVPHRPILKKVVGV